MVYNHKELCKVNILKYAEKPVLIGFSQHNRTLHIIQACSRKFPGTLSSAHRTRQIPQVSFDRTSADQHSRR